ncbi:hypothetical protein [Phytomonospora endophytica]|uniref:Uncharacterized protein n=1 Tax=Phytomonospora endophytica TaxID=714109 RepID=A0A841FPG1_9ACTN|nr:hypothetical protein [Phytomonospora endophytica]MBB6037714.1 hypothetical protein [Phytomonospora endophytica]GIG67758.1 hypothetical protein Pen01_40530 [Phytomonospora endophytica]
MTTPLEIGHEPPRRFLLMRRHDATGLSGTGTVADGLAWSDGPAVMRWKGEGTGVRQNTVWNSTEEILRIHGHGGLTDICWIDPSSFERAEGADE